MPVIRRPSLIGAAILMTMAWSSRGGWGVGRSGAAVARTISEVLARYWTVRDQGAVVGQDGFPAARREEGLDLRSDPVHVAEDRPGGIPPGRADGQHGLLE